MKGYFHYCSKGLQRDVLFSSSAEFIAGMNRIAVCHHLSEEAAKPVKILAFCLMDNHFHYILFGEEEDCNYFTDRYINTTSCWISRHRDCPLSEKMVIGHWPIAPDQIGKKILYVLRNPLAAGMRFVPSGYPWSSAGLMFTDKQFSIIGSTPLSTISRRQKEKQFYTNTMLPQEWIMLNNGLIWPGCYVSFRDAENFFPSIGRYLYDMNNSNIDKETELEMSKGNFSLPDSEVKARIVEVGRHLFLKNNISMYSLEERVQLAQLVRRELQCGVKQLSRILKLDEVALKLLV